MLMRIKSRKMLIDKDITEVKAARKEHQPSLHYKNERMAIVKEILLKICTPLVCDTESI